MNSLNKIQTKKLRVVIIIFSLLFFATAILLFYWQIVDNERFQAIANARYIDTKIPATRGSILASDGSTLAYSEPRYDVFVWLPDVKEAEKRNYQTREEFIKKISQVLEITEAELIKKLDSGPLWIKIAPRITVDQKDKLKALKSDIGDKRNILGMQYEYANRRVYPEGKLASQILGYVGFDTNSKEKGVWGLEQNWDGSLRALEGVESSEVDSFGNPITISNSDSISSKEGATLYTTINKTLQTILETKLQEGYKQFGAKSVTGIIMDPKTGAILAMANYPSFDPNTYYEETDPEVFGNKAISTPYEVGSVAKTFTLSAALDLGKVTPSTVLLPNGHRGCEIISPNPAPEDRCVSNETNKNPNKIIDCICVYNKKPVQRSIDVLDALTSSDNIAFRHIALSMSYQEFRDYLYKFGAGKVTQIDLPSESYASLKESNKWNYADQAVYSYGHGYSMTPLETITGISTIANDGDKMQPYLVSKIVDSENNVTEFKPKVVAHVIKPDTARTVSSMMHQVYLNQLIEKKYKGLAKYNIGLKSGTALIPYTDKPGYSSDINTTFLGFDASSEKKFAMIIKLEKPEVGDLSFYNARILWLDTLLAIKDPLNL